MTLIVMTHSEPSEHSFRSVRHPLHPQECPTHRTRPCVRGGTHLHYLDVRFLDRLRVRVNHILHVEKVAFFDVLEFLENEPSVVLFKINGIIPTDRTRQNKRKAEIGLPYSAPDTSCNCLGGLWY